MRAPADAARAIREYACFFGALLLFGVCALALSLPCAVLNALLPRRTGAPIGRKLIMLGFRFYVAALKALGIVRVDLKGLDALRDAGPVVIAPNHPSLLDAALIVSRLPHAVCVMRARNWNNVLLGSTARLAGYIGNESPVGMIREAARTLRAGAQLLIFPEATRTVDVPVNRFTRGFAVIAQHSQAPVQTVLIRSNSPFLGKTWPFWRKPRFPLVYEVRLGRRFQVGADTRTFVKELESYFRAELDAA